MAVVNNNGDTGIIQDSCGTGPEINVDNWSGMVDVVGDNDKGSPSPCGDDGFEVGYIYNRKNLQNAAYPEIVFCYIAQKFAYFILPHIVLYFIFRHDFFVGIVLQHAHKDAHLFCLHFFSCHVFCLLFCFNAQADYYILILA